MIGERHLLVGGGVLDQPLILRAVRYAGYLDYLIGTRMQSADFKTRDKEEEELVEKIQDMQREILSRR